MSLPFLSGCNTGGYAGVPVSFHPGIYLTQVGTSARAAMITDITDFTCFRGAMFRYTWGQIETADGVYGGIDSLIKPDLEDVAAISSGANRKRVIIMIHLRTTVSTGSPTTAEDVVPTWMTTDATYGDGQWVFTNGNPDTPAAGGKMICFWNTNVQTRFAQCIQAIADALESYTTNDADSVAYNPVEAVILSECSIGGTAITTQSANVTFPTFWEEKYSEGYYRLGLNLKTSFPRYITAAFTNFPRVEAGKMIMGGTFYTGATPVNGFIAEGVGIGAPNVVPDDNAYDPASTVFDSFSGTYWPGTHAWYDDAAGVVPIMPSWQKPDYEGTMLDDTDPGSHVPTTDELYSYTRDDLFATHIIMTRTNVGTYWADTKTNLNSLGISSIRNGGLASTKPTCYGTVDTD